MKNINKKIKWKYLNFIRPKCQKKAKDASIKMKKNRGKLKLFLITRTRATTKPKDFNAKYKFSKVTANCIKLY